MANVTADCPARLAQPIATAHCSISITMPDSQAAKPSLNTWEFQIDRSQSNSHHWTEPTVGKIPKLKHSFGDTYSQPRALPLLKMKYLDVSYRIALRPELTPTQIANPATENDSLNPTKHSINR